MKLIAVFLGLLIINNCSGQVVSEQSKAIMQTDSSKQQIIFFDDFNNNKNNWTVADNKKESGRIEGGFYYLTSNGRPYGDEQEIKIDTQKDFEIEMRIKILSGNAEHKYYYSMIFWGREKNDSYYFTFAKDGFASVEYCDGIHQRECITSSRSLQKTNLDPEAFNVYTIKKNGNTYSFFINGTQFYQMPFAPFAGNLIGIGAGRNTTLAIDYLKVMYL